MKRLLFFPLVVVIIFLWAVPGWSLPLPPVPISIPPILNPLPPIGGIIPNPIDTSCKDSPTPVQPGQGIPGLFDGQPGGTIYGPSYSTYDLGCAGIAQHPEAVIDTFIGNFFYNFAKNLIAFENGLHHLVNPPTFLNVFDKLETQGTQTLYNNFFVIFLTPSVIILGLVIIYRSKNQDLPTVVTMLAWALFVISLATLAYNSPLRMGRVADQVETSTVNTVNGALGGNVNDPNAVSDLTVNSVLKPMWYQGMLGSSAGPAVDKWGQPLWDSTTMSWADMKGDVAKISAAKQKQFADLAAEIHDSDPGTYDQLKGVAGGRWWSGTLALIGALFVVPFRIAADFILIASLILIRLIVTLIPLLAPFALHDRLSGLMLGTMKIAAAAIINAVVFAAAAALNVFGDASLLSTNSGVPQWLGVVLAGLLALVLWFATKPFRQLTRLAVGYHPVHSAHEGAREAASIGTMVGMMAVTGQPTLGWAMMSRMSQRKYEQGYRRSQYVANRQTDEPGIQQYTRPYRNPSTEEGPSVSTAARNDTPDYEQSSFWDEPEQQSFWKEPELPESSNEEIGRAMDRSAEVKARQEDLIEESA